MAVQAGSSRSRCDPWMLGDDRFAACRLPKFNRVESLNEQLATSYASSLAFDRAFKSLSHDRPTRQRLPRKHDTRKTSGPQISDIYPSPQTPDAIPARFET